MNLSYRGFLWLVSAVAVFILAGASAAIFPVLTGGSANKKVAVEIAGARVSAYVAESREERERGLAGRTFLRESEGMLFKTEKPELQVFWMKGMLIPIDIIWVRDGVVIGAETNVPPPLGASVDTALIRYPSPLFVDQVLEVPAGFVERHKISTGDRVEIKASE